MDIISTFIGSMFFMLLMIYVFKDSYNRIKAQMISISLIFIILIATNYYRYFNFISAIKHFIPLFISYIICTYLIFRRTNFFRKIKFHNNKSVLKVNEKMPSSKEYRKRYIISCIGFIILNSVFLGLMIYDFKIAYLVCFIISVLVNIIYVINCIKIGIFKKDEPIRKLIVLVQVNNKVMILSKADNNERIFDISIYLDKLREEYFVLPVCEVFYTNNDYQVHKVFMIKTDNFENKYDFTINDKDTMFYIDIIKKLKKNEITKFVVVVDENGAISIENI